MLFRPVTSLELTFSGVASSLTASRSPVLHASNSGDVLSESLARVGERTAIFDDLQQLPVPSLQTPRTKSPVKCAKIKIFIAFRPRKGTPTSLCNNYDGTLPTRTVMATCKSVGMLAQQSLLPVTALEFCTVSSSLCLLAGERRLKLLTERVTLLEIIIIVLTYLLEMIFVIFTKCIFQCRR